MSEEDLFGVDGTDDGKAVVKEKNMGNIVPLNKEGGAYKSPTTSKAILSLAKNPKFVKLRERLARQEIPVEIAETPTVKVETAEKAVVDATDDGMVDLVTGGISWRPLPDPEAFPKKWKAQMFDWEAILKGVPRAPGVYLLRLTTEHHRRLRKMDEQVLLDEIVQAYAEKKQKKKRKEIKPKIQNLKNSETFWVYVGSASDTIWVRIQSLLEEKGGTHTCAPVIYNLQRKEWSFEVGWMVLPPPGGRFLACGVESLLLSVHKRQHKHLPLLNSLGGKGGEEERANA